jgi:predicted metal-dependent peptidase
LLEEKYKKMMAERIYEILPDPPQMPSWGEVVDADPAEAAAIEADVEQRIASAIAVAKSRGSVPSIAKMLLEDMEQAQIDWRDKLRRFLSGDQPDDYTFRRPERKAFHHLGIIAPSVDHKGAGDIVIGIDTSGSVSDKELHHFLGEINAISTEVGPRSVTVICCSMHVHSVQTFEAGEEITAVMVNDRGGTRVMPVFDYIDKHDLPVSHMIYLSDMEVGDYPKSVAYPLLWVSTDRSAKAPVGETVHIRIK